MENKTCGTTWHTEIPRSKQKGEQKEVGHGRVEKEKDKKRGMRGEDVISTAVRGQHAMDSVTPCQPVLHMLSLWSLCVLEPYLA